MNQDTPITINPESKKANRAFQKRIFYVEDDQDSATMMTIILTQAGYDVTVARTLEGCLESIKGGDFDLILLDNWLKGRRKALWISKSELIEDARRDWSALGQERLLIQPLARFRQARTDTVIAFTYRCCHIWNMNRCIRFFARSTLARASSASSTPTVIPGTST